MPLALFIPCFLDQAAPQVAEAVVELLRLLKVAWRYPEEQTCCGQFALTGGDEPTARRLMRHFFRVFGDAPLVLCPSASCTYTVRHLYPRLAESPDERRAAQRLAARTFELSEWLAARGSLPWTPAFAGSLALHRSCKARELGALPGAARVLAQAPGLQLLEISPYYSCCGFGGAFSVLQPELSRIIGETYLKAAAATGATGLISLDASCLMHLQGLPPPAPGFSYHYLAEVLLP